MLISQSLIKAVDDYTNRFKSDYERMCGVLLKAQYIDNSIDKEPSDAMKEGIYFEYLATGALPKNKKIPVAETTAKGQLKEPYIRAQKAAENFKKFIVAYKIKIIKVSYYLADDEKSGVIDIYAEWNGKKVFIDLKYSGLLDDKWNDLGWNTETLSEKRMMIQGVHYKVLADDILQIPDIPFYYFVFNSKDPDDVKIILQEVDPDKIDVHRELIKNVKSFLEEEMQRGFRAYPHYRKCVKCPLFQTCDYKHSLPTIEKIH